MGRNGKRAIRPVVRIAVECPEAGKPIASRVFVLLRMIDQKGSIMKATKELGMSYSNAWSGLGVAERALGIKLIDRESTHGSVLTDAGRDLLERFERYEAAVQGFQERAFAESFDGWKAPRRVD